MKIVHIIWSFENRNNYARNYNIITRKMPVTGISFLKIANGEMAKP